MQEGQADFAPDGYDAVYNSALKKGYSGTAVFYSEKLKERLLTSTMFALHQKRGGTLTDFKWYLDIVKTGLAKPHAGYGIGNERVLQYIFGVSDIRKISLFSLLNK